MRSSLPPFLNSMYCLGIRTEVCIHNLDKMFGPEFKKYSCSMFYTTLILSSSKYPLLPPNPEAIHLLRCNTQSSKHFLNLLSGIEFRSCNVFVLMSFKSKGVARTLSKGGGKKLELLFFPCSQLHCEG